MKTLYNPFGYTDEIAMIEQFYDLYGRRVAEDLDRIYRNHSYSKDWTIFAKQEGYSQKTIDDFRQLQ